jgi:hypothetical protein
MMPTPEVKTSRKSKPIVMRLIALARLIDLFTLDRARVYSLLATALWCFVVLSSFVKSPDRLRNGTDFPAFYIAGRILNEYPNDRLYDRELQRRLYEEVAPEAAGRSNLFFVYTPFFALVCSPFAFLPYLPAFVCWFIISFALFTVGFRLAWTAATLPTKNRTDGFVLALGFLPFLTWCLFTGQTSAFGFFWLAVAVYLDRKGWLFASGCALAMLLYKPTLLILLVPMLLVTKRWRTLAGFCITAVGLGLISLALIGFSGVPAYLSLLASFSQDKATGKHPIWVDIDAFSFFLPLVNGRVSLAGWLVVILAIIVIPFLVAAWVRRRERSWAHAITWTLVLNLYVVIYDSTFMILAVLLSIEPSELSKGELPLGFRWLLLALFVVPWVETNLARYYGFHPLTIVLVAFGCYQMFRTLKSRHTPLLNEG